MLNLLAADEEPPEEAAAEGEGICSAKAGAAEEDDAGRGAAGAAADAAAAAAALAVVVVVMARGKIGATTALRRRARLIAGRSSEAAAAVAACLLSPVRAPAATAAIATVEQACIIARRRGVAAQRLALSLRPQAQIPQRRGRGESIAARIATTGADGRARRAHSYAAPSRRWTAAVLRCGVGCASITRRSHSPRELCAQNTPHWPWHSRTLEMSAPPAAAAASSTKLAYKNVVRGKLSLKGGPAKSAAVSGKNGAPVAAAAAAKSSASASSVKRKKEGEETAEEIREREQRELDRLIAQKAKAEADAAKAAAALHMTDDPDGEAAAKQSQLDELDADDSLTKAERDFQRAQKQRELELIKKKISKTHRQRVEVGDAHSGHSDRSVTHRVARSAADLLVPLCAAVCVRVAQEFNTYLGNLSEHNDIPRVGPG